MQKTGSSAFPRHPFRLLRSLGILAAFATVSLVPGLSMAQPCTVPDNGTGTVDLPPPGCPYLSPDEVHLIIDGLPAGTEIHLAPIHSQFIVTVRDPNSPLGGEREHFQSQLQVQLTGTGSLSGYSRTLFIPVESITDTGPRVPGDEVQSFPTEMFSLTGSIFGDPDFDFLTITAGAGQGLPPSPGQTVLTELPSGSFNVDSFFDITYQIDFQGQPGSVLDGFGGSTTGTIRMQAGEPSTTPTCIVPDNGTGTADLPPPGCGYVSPDDLHQMIDGLPPGTTITVAAEHDRFFNTATTPGGNLGGEVETFQSFLTLDMQGQGIAFNRQLVMQIGVETHTGPRNAGDPVQSFDTEMVSLQGQLPPGDPDFDILRIRGGTDFGLPSPGHTTLTRLSSSGNFNVDSFFDITYEIEYVGAPGGSLSGLSGTTTGVIRMGSGTTVPGPDPCVVPDNGSGTVTLPPAGCDYLSPDEVHKIIDGLPPGTEINIQPIHNRFFNVTSSPGGSLGGEVETFGSSLGLRMQGTGALSGFNRDITIPNMAAQTHTGPRNPGDPVQDFPTDMFQLQGQITGDPDFDLLRVTAGTGNGLPSPGHTTLTRLPSGDFNVDSFFDITYTIDFVGAPGGALSGMSGSTTATIRMATGVPAGSCPPIPPGVDTFPSTGKLVIEPLDRASGTPSGPPLALRLSSAFEPDTRVQRFPQVGDTIPIELIALSLTGVHPQTGPLQVRLSSSNPSRGEIQNVVQDPATCDLVSGSAHFDVFFEVDVSGVGETWVNNDPLHLRRKLRRLPPKDDPYENPFVDPVVLFDRATGQPRAQVLYEVHHVDPPYPPPGIDCFDTNLRLLVQDRSNPTAPPFPMDAFGPTTVQRDQINFLVCQDPVSGTNTGQTCLTNADCRPGEICAPPPDAFQMEIVQMDLQGTHPTLGNFQVRPRSSIGQTFRQQPDRSYPADSFFDIAIDVFIPSQSLQLHSNPIGLAAIGSSGLDGITNTPPDPGTNFQFQSGTGGPPEPLFLPSGQPSQFEIVAVNHIIGPPVSWQPPPPEEDYCFESWITLQITYFNPACTDVVMLPGNMRVLRDRPTNPGDDRDEMETLLSKALFEGQTACGPVRLLLSPSRASSGQVKSLTPDENEPYDSFFDVFIEADTAIGPLHTQSPTHMTTTINGLPPDNGEIYYGPGTVIPLFDASGAQVGEILEVSHEIHRRIVCPCDCLPLMQASGGAVASYSMLVPGTGAGARYDFVRGQLGPPGTPIPATGAVCGQSNGGAVYVESAMPQLGRAFYILARDRFGNFLGSYEDCAARPQNLDILLGGVCPR